MQRLVNLRQARPAPWRCPSWLGLILSRVTLACFVPPLPSKAQEKPPRGEEASRLLLHFAGGAASAGVVAAPAAASQAAIGTAVALWTEAAARCSSQWSLVALDEAVPAHPGTTPPRARKAGTPQRTVYPPRSDAWFPVAMVAGMADGSHAHLVEMAVETATVLAVAAPLVWWLPALAQTGG